MTQPDVTFVRDALTLSGVVLAGGRSRRMGSEKALLTVDGELLWRRQQRVLSEAGVTEMWLSARRAQTWAAAERNCVFDDVEDAGPLAGIVVALRVMRGTHLAVLAVDLPRMEKLWIQRLTAACAAGRGAVGRRDGFFEPLAAIYPREILSAAEAALANGDWALQRLIATEMKRFAVVEINAAEAVCFDNWNEPRAQA